MKNILGVFGEICTGGFDEQGYLGELNRLKSENDLVVLTLGVILAVLAVISVVFWLNFLKKAGKSKRSTKKSTEKCLPVVFLALIFTVATALSGLTFVHFVDKNPAPEFQKFCLNEESAE